MDKVKICIIYIYINLNAYTLGVGRVARVGGLGSL